VYRVEIDYKSPLKSGDSCICKLAMEKDGNLKAVFRQDIFRTSDNKLCVSGKITAVVLQNNRPVKPDFLLFPDELKK
jgi:acyl-CoA thioester hydrolase